MSGTKKRRARLAGTAALLLLLGCGKPAAEGGPEAMPPVPVKLAPLGVAEIQETGEYLAMLKSRRSLVLQPQIEGQVTQIIVAAGDKVEAGDPIMQIDPARQAALVSSEQSNRAAKLASLNYWKQQAERVALLHQGGAASQQELQQARMSYESAKADVAAGAAQVKQQKVQLHYYRVSAPAAGVVGDIPVRVGDRVTPATRLTTLDNNEMLEAYISVPIERSGELRPGMLVQLIDSAGALLAATQVSFISPMVSDETQSVLIKTVVSNDKGLLRAGQMVRARVVFGSHKGPAIPSLSVIRLGGQYFAYAVEDTGKGLVARQRAVSLGELVDNKYEVRAGLSPGQRIVVSGVQKLRDGSALVEEKEK